MYISSLGGKISSKKPFFLFDSRVFVFENYKSGVLERHIHTPIFVFLKEKKLNLMGWINLIYQKFLVH